MEKFRIQITVKILKENYLKFKKKKKLIFTDMNLKTLFSIQKNKKKFQHFFLNTFAEM